MKSKTQLDEILLFIRNWTETVQLFPGSGKLLLNDVPPALNKLDKALGAFWDMPPFPFAPSEQDWNTERGVFNVQDKIHNPRNTPQQDGVTMLVSENQGVWAFGYDQQHRLVCNGEFIWNMELTPLGTEWHVFPGEVEDALVFALLTNFFCYVSAPGDPLLFDPESTWPEDIETPLWTHPAWKNSKGFWTNAERTALLYDGWGVSRKKGQ